MRLSLATKIFAGFAAVLVVFGAVTVYGVVQLNMVRRQLGVVNRGHLPLNRLVTELEMQQESTRRSIDSILRFDNIDLQRSLISKNQRSFTANVNNRIRRATAILDKVNELSLDDRQSQFFTDANTRLKRIEDHTKGFTSDLDALLSSLGEPGLQIDESPDISAVKRRMRTMSREIRLFKLQVKNAITTQMLQVEQEESSAVVFSLWLISLAMVLSIAVTVASLWTLRPIRRLSEAARQISQGDFSASLESHNSDELGLLTDEFNRMARSLANRKAEEDKTRAEWKEVNRRLRQSSIDLELITLYNKHIIHSMHNAILVADALGEITTINPAAEIIWGLTDEAHEGKRLEQLPIAEDLERALGDLTALRTTTEPVLTEACSFHRADNTEVLVDLYTSALTGADGKRQGLLIVGEDVTEKVRTKQALILSERMAAIGRMSAVVAHEIRNPLSSIGLNTELLEDELSDLPEESTREARSILQAVSREVERLTEVTDEYLRFARMPKPHKTPVALHAILNDLLQFMQGELEEAKIRLVRQFDPDVSDVPIDANQFRQAFMNLFKNSTESMADSGGILTVATTRKRNMAEVRISDTGRGIDDKSLMRIFDPFFSTRDGGTGLGLSLTQQIVSEHGGDIACLSQPSIGTTFVVQIPLNSTLNPTPAVDDAEEDRDPED